MMPELPIDQAFERFAKVLEEPYSEYAEALASGYERQRQRALNKLVYRLVADGDLLHKQRFDADGRARWDLWWVLLLAALQLRAANWSLRKDAPASDWTRERLNALNRLIGD